MLQILIVFIFTCRQSFAKEMDTRERYIDTTREITSATGTYRADFEGITKIMNDLKEKDPVAYQKIKANYDQMNSDRSFYKYLGLGLSVGGALAMIFSKSLAGDNPTNAAAVGGGAALVGGVATLFFLPPGEERINNFIKEHDQATTKSPVQFGIQIEPKGSLSGMIRLTIF
jgi:hypothetical protein